jgi:hypothetical protein
VVIAIVSVTLLGVGLLAFRRSQNVTKALVPASGGATHLVFAKVIDRVDPFERERKYEQPLAAALERKRLGEVTGGGTMQAKDGRIEWVGIDIELVNLIEGLDFTRAELRRLGAPVGSTLEYTANGEKQELPIHPP